LWRINYIEQLCSSSTESTLRHLQESKPSPTVLLS
jgi:hypothetical protein